MAPYKHTLVPWAVTCLLALLIGGCVVSVPHLKEKQAGLLWNTSTVTVDTVLCGVDCAYEADLVRTGYTASVPAVYFAKYPLMNTAARIIWRIRDIRPELILFLLSKAGLWFGLAELYRLITHLYGASTARRTVWWVLFPPTLAAYTWLTTYPESWQLGFTCLAFTFYFAERPWRASVPTALLILARPQGMFLLAALGAGVIWHRRDDRSRLIADLVALSLLPLLAWAGWMIVTYHLTHSVLAPISVQASEHGRELLGPPFALLVHFIKQRFAVGLVNTRVTLRGAQLSVLLVECALMGNAWWRGRLRAEFAVFALLAFLLPLHTSLLGAARFAVVTPLAWLPVTLPPSWDRRIQRAEPVFWTISAAGGVLLTLVMVSYLNVEWHVNWLP